MIVGHLGVALLGRRLSRVLVPLSWAAIAAYMPDVIRLVLVPWRDIEGANLLSHSIPAIGLQALCVTLFFRWCQHPWSGAFLLGALTLLHWPADLLTGCKETWPGGPLIGLALYRRPLIDLAIEMALVIAALLVTPRTERLAGGPKRLPLATIAVGLFVLQLAGVATIAATSTIRYRDQDWQWTPTVALTRFRLMRVPPPVCLTNRLS